MGQVFDSLFLIRLLIRALMIAHCHRLRFQAALASATIAALMFSAPFATAQTRPYVLDDGDILAVIVDGVLGSFKNAPIHLPREGSDIIAGMGHPVPVREDGTVSLPLMDPISVRGLTVVQAQKRIERAYIDSKILIKRNQVMVNLMRKRTIRVAVITNRYPNPYSNEQVRSVDNVTIPEAQADTLTALAASGGSFDDTNIRVLRNRPLYGKRMQNRQVRGPAIQGQLREGDIVDARLPDAGYFFAGGQLDSGRYRLPTTYPLTATQALAQTGGQAFGQGGGPSQVLVTRSGRTRVYNRNWLLNNPNAVIIQPGDVVTLRQSSNDFFNDAAISILRWGLIRGF